MLTIVYYVSWIVCEYYVHALNPLPHITRYKYQEVIISNFFVINAPSNLITHVTASSYTPPDSKVLRFIKANDKSLTCYYKWREKNPGLCMDIGDLQARSTYIDDQVSGGRVGNAKPMRIRIADEQRRLFVDRETQVRMWIDANPNATPYELDEALNTSVYSARVYMLKYANIA
ncbi:hypothetical protein BK673_16155 [Pseudomonas fluorescens]|uniref:Uncharacterized protein n=1 Tax=Pseudomonas fluorescens TaxID=294 RepID=A0A423P4B1_PSEFL|nr:hypothetical protein BK673_16155 [Pseudomonas fluorescens]